MKASIKPRLDQCLTGQTVQYELWVNYPTVGPQFVSATYAPYVETDGTISGVVVSLRNITQLKQAETALQQSEERLQLAFEASGDGLWDWHISTGTVYYSPQYFQMLGYAADELPQELSTWEQLVHPEDMVWVREILAAHLKDNSSYSFDYRLKTQSGEWKWVADYGRVVAWDDQGNPLRMIGTHRDIHKRKQAEKELALQRRDCPKHGRRDLSGRSHGWHDRLRQPQI
ncbi:PAS domain-containing protein [Kovacikia minuta CCNUW1]|uniref:PAS domain-containing protein n=1 Tax=Kovacikia minuta TaxID=2931930 RepID=UPI001CCEDB37|nr:PAS domain-containing protein [Kovacikia minuta]UBF26477.1 PAS domain-containing protein [Kovacikia minuta CCNUW1]